MAVVGALLNSSHWVIAGVSLTTSLLTMLSMARVWDEAFWKPMPSTPVQARLNAAIVAPIAWLVCLTVAVTVAAGPVYNLSLRAATQVLDVNGYVRAVLGGERTRAAR